MKKVLLCVLSFIALTAFAAGKPPKVNESELRKEFTSLKDQDSAKFRNIKFAPAEAEDSWVMCGEYNAKNSYGGYAGFSRFMGMVIVKGRQTMYFVVTVEDGVANSMCAKHGL